MRQIQLIRVPFVWSLLLLAFASLPSAAGPDAVQQCEYSRQPSFNCADATNAVEQEICSNPDAAMSDCLMGQIFRDATRLATTNEAKQQLLNQQRAWVQRRTEQCSQEETTIQSCLIAQSETRSWQLINQFGLGPAKYGFLNAAGAESSIPDLVAQSKAPSTLPLFQEMTTTLETQTQLRVDAPPSQPAIQRQPYENPPPTLQQRQQMDRNLNTLIYLLWYFFISGFFGLPLVRPILMNWYRNQGWFFVGTGPVDIFFRQIGARISFELFVFGVACVVGGLGGWIYLIYRSINSEIVVNPNGRLGRAKASQPQDAGTFSGGAANLGQTTVDAAQRNTTRDPAPSLSDSHPRSLDGSDSQAEAPASQSNSQGATPWNERLTLDDLSKIARLRDEGILSEAEYQSLKQNILNSAHKARPAESAPEPLETNQPKPAYIVALLIALFVSVIWYFASSNTSTNTPENLSANPSEAASTNPTGIDIMSSRFGNTTITTDATGKQTRFYYNNDHTFRVVSEGQNLRGVWQLRDNKICFTYEAPPPDTHNPVCVAFSWHSVGDTWTTGSGRNRVTSTLVQGVVDGDSYPSSKSQPSAVDLSRRCDSSKSNYYLYHAECANISTPQAPAAPAEPPSHEPGPESYADPEQYYQLHPENRPGLRQKADKSFASSNGNIHDDSSTEQTTLPISKGMSYRAAFRALSRAGWNKFLQNKDRDERAQSVLQEFMEVEQCTWETLDTDSRLCSFFLSRTDGKHLRVFTTNDESLTVTNWELDAEP